MPVPGRERSLLRLAGGVILALASGWGAVAAEGPAAIINGVPANAVQSLIVPLFLDQREAGEVRVWFRPPARDAQVEAAPVLKELGGLVLLEIEARLKGEVDPQGRLALDALTAAGLEAAFDPRNLELHLRVPPAARRPVEVQVYGRRPPRGAEEALRPADVSAYLNLRTGAEYVHQSQAGVREGWQPWRLDLEGAVNVRDWVLEAYGAFAEDGATRYQRREVRLVRDDVEHRLRYSVGDLQYPVVGFQSFLAMGGVSLARNFNLQPYRVTEPLGRTSFFLKRDSKVEVLVNGRPAQTLQMQAGPHTIRDFLFASGANDVTLRITDPVGNVETIELNYFYDSRLLAQGEHEFAYNLGVPARLAAEGYRYETDTPAWSLFHRVGLTDTLTAGANFQGTDRVQMLGGEIVTATPVGTFSADLAGSWAAGREPGLAAGLQYRYYDATPGNRAGRIYSLGARYRGEDFAAFTGPPAAGLEAADFFARYSQQLPWRMSGGVGATYQLNLAGPRDTKGINLFLSKRLGWNTTVEVSLDWFDTLKGATEFRAFVSLNLQFPAQRQSLNASYDSLNEVGRLDWHYTPPRNVGGLAASVGLQYDPRNYGVFGGATYTDPRAELSLAQDIAVPSVAGLENDIRTRLRLGTALVFADGHFGISRPVQDSFALVAAHASLKGLKIGTEPIGETYSAASSWLSPAVVPDLQSYQVRQIVTDIPNLPPGYDPGPDLHVVRPTYRSGTVLRAGSDAHLSVTGTLTFADGEPVALQAGELVDPNDPARPPVTLFTNRKGRFFAEGLQPGAFQLRLFGHAQAVVDIGVPKDQPGTLDLGVLKLPPGVTLP